MSRVLRPIIATLATATLVGHAHVVSAQAEETRGIDVPRAMPALVGTACPDIRLPTLDGQGSFAVSGFREHKLLILEWASWSADCRRVVPFWHAKTERLRGAGELELLGIAQEQHRERAQLWAQWQELDWPVLWDPFNLTGCADVPRVIAVDEYGIVRAVNPTWEQLEREFFGVDFPEPERLPTIHEHGVPSLIPRSVRGDETVTNALTTLLWQGPDDEVLRFLGGVALAATDTPAAVFQLGVAHGIRFNSPTCVSGDLGAALDAWTRAARDSERAVWRSRVELYGPRTERSAAFYDWCDAATAALRGRGVEPVAASSTGRGDGPGIEGVGSEDASVEPDPEGEVRADEGLVELGTAIGFGMPPERGRARVHLTFVPSVEDDVRWRNEVLPMSLWIADVPEGWSVERRRLTASVPSEAVSSEPRTFDFDVAFPPSVDLGTLHGYALFRVSSGEEGAAILLRRDFDVRIAVP